MSGYSKSYTKTVNRWIDNLESIKKASIPKYMRSMITQIQKGLSNQLEHGWRQKADMRSMVEKLSAAVQEACEQSYIDENDVVTVQGHGAFSLRELLEESDVLLGKAKETDQ